MSTTKIRKTIEQVIEEEHPEINPVHVNDWHTCTSGAHFKAVLNCLPVQMKRTFNFMAAITAPKTIKFRQRDCDFIEGKKGDYLFVDQNGGRFGLPYKLFKRIFK